MAPGLPEITTTTQRKRNAMPVGPTRTKAQKANVVHTEMSKSRAKRINKRNGK
jgi:hypothetical protein